MMGWIWRLLGGRRGGGDDVRGWLFLYQYAYEILFCSSKSYAFPSCGHCISHSSRKRVVQAYAGACISAAVPSAPP